MAFSLLLYGYLIVGSIFLDDLKYSLETYGNITCYLNPIGSMLTLYPDIAAVEFILFRTFFLIYPYRFLALNHERLSLPVASSVPIIAASLQIYHYVTQGTLCRKEPLEMLHYKIGVSIGSSISFSAKPGLRFLLFLIFILSVAIRFIFWLFRKINNRRKLKARIYNNRKIISNNSQMTTASQTENGQTTDSELSNGLNQQEEIAGPSLQMCEIDTDSEIRHQEDINKSDQAYNTEQIRLPALTEVKPIAEDIEDTEIVLVSPSHQNPIFTLNVRPSGVAGFHEIPTQSRKTNQALGSLSDKLAGPLGVLVLLIALLSLGTLLKEGPAHIKSYIFSIISDCVLLVMPIYWVMCVKEVTDFAKLRFYQLRARFGFI